MFLVFGAFQEQNQIPNQEIVLEFIGDQNNHQQIENTIDDLAKKLNNLGASNITIKEKSDGTLKISYHSNVDANSIKELLASNEDVSEKKNSDQQPKENYAYHLDVYELVNSSDLQSSPKSYLVELKSNFDRSTQSHHFAFTKDYRFSKENYQFSSKVKAIKQHCFSKTPSSNGEPEVRAGPIC